MLWNKKKAAYIFGLLIMYVSQYTHVAFNFHPVFIFHLTLQFSVFRDIKPDNHKTINEVQQHWKNIWAWCVDDSIHLMLHILFLCFLAREKGRKLPEFSAGWSGWNGTGGVWEEAVQSRGAVCWLQLYLQLPLLQWRQGSQWHGPSTSHM